MAKPKQTRYKLIKQVGAGDFAKVYAAQDVKLGRKVAIKQLHSQYMDDEKKLSRYWQEAKLLLDLEHPNIMTIYDVVKTRGRLVLELMQGSLKQVYGGKPMPVADVRQTIRQAATGLACLHENGIIHGDIKPANLMLSRTNVVKLGDFGLARRASDDQGSMLKGTTKYMAPELVSEEFGAVGPPSDLYSLGFTALELMVGPDFDSLFPDLVAFGRDKQMAWMMWHCSADRHLPVKTVLNGVPDDLANVLEKLTSKDQSKRYQTAQQVVADLTGSAKPVGESVKEERAAAEEAAKQLKKKRRLRAIAACFASLILCAALVFFMREKPKETARVAPPPVEGVVRNILPFDDKFVIETGEGKKEFELLPGDKLKLNRKSAVLRDLEKDDRLVVNTVIQPGAKDRYEIVAFRPEQHSGMITEIKPDANQFSLSVGEGDEVGQVFDLKVEDGTEIIVNKQSGTEEVPLTLADLQKDDQVMVNLCEDLQGMLALKVDAIRKVHLQGVIRKLVPRQGTMTIADTSTEQERLVTLPLDAGCTFSLNGAKSLNDRLLNAMDIKIGDQVKIQHDVKITNIDAYRPFEDKGIIRSVGYDSGSLLLKSQSATRSKSYSIGPKTQILLGEEAVTLDELRAGDEAQLVHDSPNDKSPTLLSLNVQRLQDRNKWAILIGIDQYNSLQPLSGSVANIGAIESRLANRFGVRPDQIKKFENPTQITIQQEIPGILRRLGSRDELFVYIATRGFIDKGKGAYLATKGFSLEEIETTGLPLDWLIDAMDGCESPKKVLFLECPAESTGETGPATATEMVQLLQETKRGGYPKYTHILANAQPGDKTGGVVDAQSQYGAEFGEQTAFGAAISEAFSGKADRERDSKVQITELTNYVTKRAARLASSADGKQSPYLFTPDDRPPRILDVDKEAIISLLTEFSNSKLDHLKLIKNGELLRRRTKGQPEPMLATGIILIKSFKMSEALDILEQVRLKNRSTLLAHQGVIWLHLYKRQYDQAGIKLQQMLGQIGVPEDGEVHDPTVLKKFQWAGAVRELVGGSSDWNQRVPDESVLAQCDKLVAPHGRKAIELYQAGRAPIRQKINQYTAALKADPSSDIELVRKRVKSYDIQIATPDSIQEIRESLEMD